MATLIRFWNDDEGLVALESVALAVGVAIIHSRENTAASTVSSKLVVAVQSNS